MSDCVQEAWPVETREKAAWPAVFSLTLGVFGLVMAEFLPASLLTPMAHSLHVSAAVAGQTVTVTAAMALIGGLLAAVVTRGIDRRFVLMGFSALLVVSDLLVAVAPNLFLILLARLLLGVALGGFWSMATAVAMRLVPDHKLPRALSMVFSGVSMATIVAVPLGSYLGSLYGWRSVFVLGAAIGVVTLLFQAAALPRLAPTTPARLATLVHLLRRRGIALGVGISVLVFGGHFALFTYIRPLLETSAGFDVAHMALVLLGFGVANFFGTLLAGWLLERSLRFTLAIMPLLIGVAALGLAALSMGLVGEMALVAAWGIGFGAMPVAWSTWTARASAPETESGGGLIVAAIQAAIAFGAAGGGLIFGLTGVVGVFYVGGALMLVMAAAIWAGMTDPAAG